MAEHDEPLPSGWLPPRAPGAGERPRFEPGPGGSPPSPPPPPAPPQEAATAPGWTAPRAPVHHTGTGAPPRQPGAWPRDPAQAAQPSSPAAVISIAMSSVAILLLLLSLGLAFFISGLLSASALMSGVRVRKRIRAGAPGRDSQARAAVTVASVGLGLAFVAGLVWIILSASGVSPQDVQDALQRELERRRSSS
jgi:hypothetical protein